MLAKKPEEMTDEELEAALKQNLDWQYWLEEGWALEPVPTNRNYHPTEREHNACAEDHDALEAEKQRRQQSKGRR